MTFLFLIAGLVFLTVGAELLVRSAARIARIAGISPLIIGLTIVALGTSSPEIAVSIDAALTGKGAIAVGNVVGSNIFNVLFILGASALIVPLTVSRQLIRLDVPVMIGVSVLAAAVCGNSVISRMEGAVLLILFAAYTLVLIVFGRREPDKSNGDLGKEGRKLQIAPKTFVLQFILILVGLILLIAGSHWFVAGSIALAQALGISDRVIGLTIVAAGTSMPEVATSVMASVRGERDIAIGNVVGSNILNILVVLGLSSLIAPGGLPVAQNMIEMDIIVMIAAAVACLPILFSGWMISRLEGGILLFYYAYYVLFLFLHALESPLLKALNSAFMFVLLPLTCLILLISVVYSERSITHLVGALGDDLQFAARKTLAHVRKVVVFVVGGTVLLVGLAMTVLPGPAMVVIPLGLAILATEFVWAKRLLNRIKKEIKNAGDRFRGSKKESSEHDAQ